MPIVVTCPSCSATLKAPDTAAGKRVKCPKCTSPIDVPAAAAAPAPPIVEAEFTDEPLPPPARAEAPPHREDYGDAVVPPPGQISRQTVGLVAVLGPGALGIHKFILGKTTPGLIMLIVSLLCFPVGGFAVMWVIALIEGIKFLRMSDAEFYDTYVAGDKAWL